MSNFPSLGQQPKQNQTQTLIMSAKMQQALRLLKLPVLELQEAIQEEIEQNPLLEEQTDEESFETELDSNADLPLEKELEFDEKDFEALKQIDEMLQEEKETFTSEKKGTDEEKLRNFLENSIQSQVTLTEFLHQQIREHFDNQEEKALAELLVGYLDENGFLTTPLQEIATISDVNVSTLEAVLKVLKTFDPPGIGAAHLQDCFLIQLNRANKTKTLAYTIAKEHFDDLVHNKMQALQKKLKCSFKELQEALSTLSKLSFHPTNTFSKTLLQKIEPDIFIWEDENDLRIEINERPLPSLRFNRKYLSLLEDPLLSLETKHYIKKKILNAKWLFQNIYQRNSTLEKIATYLIQTQKEFLIHPKGKLSPLTMKTMAETLELHESTIARSIQNKYLFCPAGLFPLRSFFTHSYQTEKGKQISSKTVQQFLQKFILNEDKKHPLSDEDLSKLLKNEGICCARRTIAKYRTLLGIGNTSQRKKI